MSLDLAPICNARGKALAHLFTTLHKQKNNDSAITDDLLDAIYHEALPPTVFGTWLLVSQSDDALVKALRQSRSCVVRKSAIQQLRSRLRRVSWKETWDKLGGTEGMIAMFAQFSVTDVKGAASAVGHCSKGHRSPAREACIEGLLRGLVPSVYTDVESKSTDRRPLLQYYARIVPACSSRFVGELLDQDSNPLLPYIKAAHLLKHHPALVRQHVLGEINSSWFDDDSRFWYCLPKLCRGLPSGPPDSSGFSPSMSYALSVLTEYAKSTGSQLSMTMTMVMEQVAAPLISRAMKNGVAIDKFLNIANVALEYVQRNPEAARCLSSKKGGLLYRLTQYWSLKGAARDATLNEILIRCLTLYSDESQGQGIKGLIGDLIGVVPRKQRYTLMCLIMKHAATPSLDLNDMKQLKASFTDDVWPCRFFTEIEKHDARILLKQLIRFRHDSCLLEIEAVSLFNHYPTPSLFAADPGLLQTLLDRGEPGAVSKAEQGILFPQTPSKIRKEIADHEQEVRKRQQKSSTSREQTDRAFYAKSAMYYAIASGSLALYLEVVKWSRRFIRDPITVKTIYSRNTITIKHGIDLLSGVSVSPIGVPSITDSRHVVEANEILKELFNIACSALYEPSFHVSDWTAIKELFSRVIERRLEVTESLKARFDIPDDLIYRNVWENTIVTLIDVERSACMPEQARLEFHSALGPLGGFRSPQSFRAEHRYSESSYRFFDKLAEARDELWRTIRPSQHPSAASLRQPWPKGLPIQCLTVTLPIAAAPAGGLTPYLRSRAMRIVFLDADVALSDIPSDEETRAAVGPFVESYNVALRIYVMQQPKESNRQLAVSQAWEHAMASLTPRGHMVENEAITLWRSRFHAALGKESFVLPNVAEREYPVLPTTSTITETLEWHPSSEQLAELKPRELPAKAIDCLLTAKTGSVDVSQPFQEPRPRTSSYVAPWVWDTSKLKGKSAKVLEGLTASALLYIDSRENKASRILAQPFPSADRSRYTALILDSDFLLSGSLSNASAVQVIKRMITQAPPSLLLDLVTGIFETSSYIPSDSRETATTSNTAYQLLALLTKSDRPDIASELVLRTILDRPESSSWHRQFLSPTYLCSLSPFDARRFIMAFAGSIETKLAEQSLARSADVEAGKSTVKITTVKHLAQLLRDAKFLFAEDRFKILSSLFQKSTHVDVQCAVVESLLFMLAQCAKDDDLVSQQQVMKGLEMVIPVAGRLHERQGLEVKSIDALEAREALPIVEDKNTDRPIFGLLLRYASDLTLSVEVRRDIVRLILLPAFKASEMLHFSWIKLFLARKRALPSLDLTASTPVPSMLVAMLRAIPELLPTEIYEAWHRYTMINLAPHSELSRFNNTLESQLTSEDEPGDHPSARDVDAEKHWLDTFNQGAKVLERFMLADLLRRDLASVIEVNGITVAWLQRHVSEQARIMIRNFNKYHNDWARMIEPLRQGTRRSIHEFNVWLKHCKPVLEDIITCIKSYRKDPQWRNNRDRKPSFLPSVFELRLFLVPLHPRLAAANAPEDKQYADYAGQVSELLVAAVNTGKTYHRELQQLQNNLLNKLTDPEKVEVALCLGGLTDPPELSIVEHLQIELAHWLLREAERCIRTTPELLPKCERLFSQWRQSTVEEFRMRGCLGLDKSTCLP